MTLNSSFAPPPSAVSQPLPPGLYLVGTPIGNLGDITLRALDVLARVQVILCEDTRVTGKLLQHYGISKPLAVYNDHSEHGDHTKTLSRIQAGDAVALVSDAGMPLLSDPGYQLVHTLQEAGVMVTSIPGPSSITVAAQLSGLPTDAFAFVGFLPNKSGERRARLSEFKALPATLILFERAQRVGDLLEDVRAALGNRQVAVARELTKLFEHVRRGALDDVQARLVEDPLRGEVVVLIDRANPNDLVPSLDDVQGRLRGLMGQVTLREAVDQVTQETKMPRRQVYDLALSLKSEVEDYLS